MTLKDSWLGKIQKYEEMQRQIDKMQIINSNTSYGPYNGIVTPPSSNNTTANKFKILGTKWYTVMNGYNIGFVATDSYDGHWKVHIGTIKGTFSSTEESDAQYIVATGAKIKEWEVAAALFPQLDSQLFIH